MVAIGSQDLKCTERETNRFIFSSSVKENKHLNACEKAPIEYSMHSGRVMKARWFNFYIKPIAENQSKTLDTLMLLSFFPTHKPLMPFI